MPVEPTGRRRGLRIGKYELSSPIATWGASGVYRARDTEKNRDVFLKLLPAEVASKPALRDRLQREAAQAAELKTPHSIGVLECGEANGTWYVAVEPVEVVGLGEHRSRHGPPSAGQTRRFLREAATALKQAQKKNFLPSEVTPSSFVIVTHKKQPELRWVPLSLLREARSEAGVNPADYQAPEQRRRDPRDADARTLMYALAAVFVRLASGAWSPTAKDPTAELADADWQGLRAVLRRMLAPRLEDRFASWDDILRELDRQDAGQAEDEGEQNGDQTEPDAADDPGQRWSDLGALAAAEGGADGEGPVELDDDEGAAKQAAATEDAETDDAERDDANMAAAPPARKTVARRRVEEHDDNQASEKEQEGPARSKKRGPAKVPLWVLAASMVAVAAVVVVIMKATSGPPKQPDQHVKVDDKKQDDRKDDKKDEKKIDQQPEKKDDKKDEPKEAPKPKPPPSLYTPAVPLDLQRLFQEFEGPWAGAQPIPKDAVVFTVVRVPPTNPGDKQTRYFDSVAAACAAAEKGRTTIVEIYDNGPFFEPAIAVADRNIVIRGFQGYRPLVAWDLSRPKEAAKDASQDAAAQPAFITVTNGNLLLGNLDVVLEWPAKNGPSASLARVVQGDFLAWSSTFSVTGDFKSPGSAVRFEGPHGARNKCRLSGCLVRGNIHALDLRAPTGEVLMDDCLLVGGDDPLLRVQAGSANGRPTVRMLRCSAFAGQTFLEVAPPSDPAGQPALTWLGWDVCLARDRKNPGGVLLQLPAEAAADDCQWKATNCLYVNWQTLLDGKTPIKASETAAWNQRWKQTEGDKALATPLFIMDGADPAEVHPIYFRLDQSAFAFAATYGPGLLGCDVEKLPYVRPSWRTLTYHAQAIPPIEVLRSGAAPPIPKGGDGKYYGGRLELGAGKNELSSFLTKMHDKSGLGSVVVLHLAGTGVQRFAPVYLHNISLTLYFEPPQKGEPPLVLVGDAPEYGPKWQHAYLQLDGGSLEIVGGDIRCPEQKDAKLLKYLVHIKDGNLRIHGAKLHGPMAPPKDVFWGLIRLEGTGRDDPRLVRGMTIHESTLISAPIVLHLVNPGIRMRLEQNLIVAAGDALHIDAVAPSGRANIQCTLHNNTIAARQSVVRVGDVRPLVIPDPILIQTKLNAFQSPFGEPATLLLGDGLALPRGLVNWKGETDAFDPRFAGYAVSSEKGGLPKLTPPQTFSAWQRMFGPQGSDRAITDLTFKGTLALDKMQLDQLATPSQAKLHPGARLDRLGIGVKKATPKKGS